MPFSPTDISGLKVWLKGDAGLGLSDGDPIATWSDQSGGSHNFTESTNKPTYKAAIRNGLGVVRFTDGSSQILSGGDLSALFSTAGSVFVAANGTNAFNNQMIYEHQNIDSWWQFGAAGYFGPFRNSRLSSTGTFSNGWHVWSITANNGTAYKVWLDTVNKINDTGGFTFTPGTSHVIGRQRTNGSTGSQDIGEIIIYDSVLSDVDRASVESYLASRWAITLPNATVAAPQAAATADAFTPTVNAIPSPTATSTAASNIPTVKVTVVEPQATATAAALVPTAIGTGTGVTVTAPLATGTGSALVATVMTGSKVVALLAAATGTANIPTITPVIVGTLATATATANAPTVIHSYTTIAVQAVATARVDQPAVLINGYPGSGHVPGDVGAGGTPAGVGDFWTVELL